jgi:hypothetical protein
MLCPEPEYQEEREQRRRKAQLARKQNPASRRADFADAILDEIAVQEMVTLARKRLSGEKEQHLFLASFEWGLKPREIVARWPHLFEDIQEVYRLKENILKRLRRDGDLEALWDGGKS